MKDFDIIGREIVSLLESWEPVLLSLPQDVLSDRRNSQQRTIRQLLGHLVDSASNNTHRMIHLQYQISPLQYPNYATYGNNDRWIAIQDYQHENWYNLVMLWKYANLHWVHVVNHVDPGKLDNLWQSDTDKFISLREGITDYLRHLRLHLEEIRELIENPETT